MTSSRNAEDESLPLPGPCVVLCPPLADQPPPAWFAQCRRSLTALGLGWVDARQAGSPSTLGAAPPGTVQNRWVAGVAARIAAGASGRPLIVVAEGATVLALPALARSQQAVRHSVFGYVLVDGALPAVATGEGDWPGAPVTYVRTPGSAGPGWRAAKLHGWRCVEGDPVTAVLQAVAEASGGFAKPDPGGFRHPRVPGTSEALDRNG